MNKNYFKLYKEEIFMFLRYFLLLLLMFSLPILYKIFLPLTLNSVFFILHIFYNSVLTGNSILINNLFSIEIIPSCVAGSAYLLLLILNLSTPMQLKKRIYSIIFSIFLLFILNILRIFLLAVLLINKIQLFDITHELFWYFFSTIFIVFIWFWATKIFKIAKIPVYSDFKHYIQQIKNNKQ